MDKIISKIFILVFVVISCGIGYRIFFYEKPIEEKIILGQEFTINKEDVYSIKNLPNSSFKITKIGASMLGYVLEYELQIANNIITDKTIENSDYSLEIISSDYKNYATLIITKKEVK